MCLLVFLFICIELYRLYKKIAPTACPNQPLDTAQRLALARYLHLYLRLTYQHPVGIYQVTAPEGCSTKTGTQPIHC